MRVLILRSIRFADIFSIMNLSFGFLSIIFLIDGEYWIAFDLILLSILSDGVDGVVARKFGSSKVGENLDSLADLVSFSISSSLMVYLRYSSSYLIPFLILYIILSMIRLSSFYLFRERGRFLGLPSPASGLILALSSLLIWDFKLIVFIIIILSALMVTSIFYPKPDSRIGPIAFIIIFLTLIFTKDFDFLFPKILFLSSFLYMIFGPLYLFLSKR